MSTSGKTYSNKTISIATYLDIQFGFWSSALALAWTKNRK